MLVCFFWGGEAVYYNFPKASAADKSSSFVLILHNGGLGHTWFLQRPEKQPAITQCESQCP